MPTTATTPLCTLTAQGDELCGLSRPLLRVVHGPHEGFPRVVDRALELPLAMAGTVGGFTETWSTREDVVVEDRGDIAVAHDGDTLVCAGFVPYQPVFAGAVEETYRRALGLAALRGYDRIYRMWNTVGRINQENGRGLEVYRDFCVGRARAFTEAKIDTTRMPAATGIGSLGKGISFYFLASRAEVVVNFENPRQVPAYRYPREYGPVSPSFARATKLAGADALFLSGTASVLGHRTVHAGDLDGQLRTTRDNIDALLSSTSSSARRPWGLDVLKVYVRHHADIDRVSEYVEAELPTAQPPVFMNVDVCRSDLLLEIEGIAKR